MLDLSPAGRPSRMQMDQAPPRMNQGAVLAINRLEPNRSRRSEPASYAKALRSLLTKLNGEAEAALGRWPKRGGASVATICQ